MSEYSLLPGVSSHFYDTSRLRIHTLSVGKSGLNTVVFVHGNASASRFWEETMLALPAEIHSIAVDMRGYGLTEAKAIDGTRGMRDFADDLHALLSETNIAPGKVHLVGWSAGTGALMQYAMDHADRIASMTLIAAMSPFGFGGSKGVEGTLTCADGAGSGGGTANPEFVKQIAAGETGEESPFSPRNVMNQFYFKPPFRAAKAREDVFVGDILSTKTGEGFYPGDLTVSPNWPGIGPGKGGMNNALSPMYCNLAGFAKINPQPRVLWVRGAEDQIVSDTSLFDLGYLGKLGAVPGWPGEDAFPPQPMISQLRGVLDAYRSAGGTYHEEVLPGVGHSPHVEDLKGFLKAFLPFVAGR